MWSWVLVIERSQCTTWDAFGQAFVVTKSMSPGDDTLQGVRDSIAGPVPWRQPVVVSLGLLSIDSVSILASSTEPLQYT